MRINRLKRFTRVLLIFFVFFFTTAYNADAGSITPALKKIIDSLKPDDEVRVIINLFERAKLDVVKAKNKSIRRSEIIRALRDKADTTQDNLKLFLEGRAKKIKSLWIINGISVTMPVSLIYELDNFPGVESITLDYTITTPVINQGTAAPPEWNISAIKAPELWDLGYTGSGVVVANMDTGVDVYHPDLQSRWRGGMNSWYDPNGEHGTPYDSDGHGTQTMGIMVGGSNGGTVIGVAPDAKWIAVKIFNDAGFASLGAIHQGFQWLLDPDGNPDTNDAPDVVSNSWGLENNVNECITEFQDDIAALKAAEIAVVFSGGNNGPGSSTSISPGNYPESFAVGAIDDTHIIANFSSRGPSACDGSIYPLVVAPGVNIKTTDLTFGGIFPNSYVNVSGTSLSAPHVAGSMALLLGASNNLKISELESILKQSASDLGIIGQDNDYGHGFIDVMEAYNLISTSTSCTDADGDGYYAESGCGTAQDCNDSNAKIYPTAPEVKKDGIDQDCNGYDLTIEILRAVYGAKRDSLRVEASSNLGREANLELAGYGLMKYRGRHKWIISLNHAGGNPGSVTISGIEGAESAVTTIRR